MIHDTCSHHLSRHEFALLEQHVLAKHISLVTSGLSFQRLPQLSLNFTRVCSACNTAGRDWETNNGLFVHARTTQERVDGSAHFHLTLSGLVSVFRREPVDVSVALESAHFGMKFMVHETESLLDSWLVEHLFKLGVFTLVGET